MKLDGSKVARQLLTLLLAVCKEWLDQFPPLSAPVGKTELSMFGMKNTRRKMEDRYAICLDVNSLYGLKASHMVLVVGSVCSTGLLSPSSLGHANPDLLCCV